MKIADVSVLGRNTQGVRLMNLKESEEKVTGVAVVDAEVEVPDSQVPPVTH
jgi:DNA gyrase subunit A